MGGHEKHAQGGRFSFLVKLLIAFTVFCLLVNYVVGLNTDFLPK